MLDFLKVRFRIPFHFSASYRSSQETQVYKDTSEGSRIIETSEYELKTAAQHVVVIFQVLSVSKHSFCFSNLPTFAGE